MSKKRLDQITAVDISQIAQAHAPEYHIAPDSIGLPLPEVHENIRTMDPMNTNRGKAGRGF